MALWQSPMGQEKSNPWYFKNDYTKIDLLGPVEEKKWHSEDATLQKRWGALPGTVVTHRPQGPEDGGRPSPTFQGR